MTLENKFDFGKFIDEASLEMLAFEIQEIVDNWIYCKGRYLIDQLEKLELTSSQLASVLLILDNTCYHCWEATPGCRCWDDR